ncbi:GNAT domain-containing protein [Mycena rosella]|uniref:GNAT domain-containing protein n=1 Tax=Mycena rosella TaxID=1033263 RepID=A0AAD7MB03_MYCRO|nr:GNAT domain-containing protein [Mycena rosella]
MNALEFNAATGEPFLRLPAPFTNIIITPPPMSDVEPSIAILNNPAVGIWMGPMGAGPAYTASKAEQWLTKVKAETDIVMQEVRSATSGPFSGCPVRHIREVREDGTDVFIGDLGFARSSWTEVLDADEKARLAAENNARAVGDPDIVWHVGYYLAPSHQGRGVMTAAVKTIITQWGIPYMGAKCIRSSAFEGNPGSIKVLEKNGFVITDTLVEHVDMGKAKKWTLCLLERV